MKDSRCVRRTALELQSRTLRKVLCWADGQSIKRLLLFSIPFHVCGPALYSKRKHPRIAFSDTKRVATPKRKFPLKKLAMNPEVSSQANVSREKTFFPPIKVYIQQVIYTLHAHGSHRNVIAISKIPSLLCNSETESTNTQIRVAVLFAKCIACVHV